MNRLETVSKNLAERLAAASPERQRKVSIIACELALQVTGLDMEIVLKSFEQLQHNGKLPHELTVKLNELAAQLDERYFDIQSEDEDNISLQAESLQLFSHARTVSAISFAGGEDTLFAVMESIYEASMAFEDSGDFFQIINDALSKPES